LKIKKKIEAQEGGARIFLERSFRRKTFEAVKMENIMKEYSAAAKLSNESHNWGGMHIEEKDVILGAAPCIGFDADLGRSFAGGRGGGGRG
jgi:hypothetical protein